MPCRRLLAFGALACLLAVPVVAYWLLTPTPGATLANFKRLHQGMTMQEIEAIMGRPADESLWVGRHNWNGPDGVIWILATDSKHVHGGLFFPTGAMPSLFYPEDTILLAPNPPEGFITKISRWVGR